MTVEIHPRLSVGSIKRSDRHEQNEYFLVNAVAKELRANWPVRADGREVKSHGRCRTDIVVLLRDINSRERDELLVGVEAKLTDGNRALSQAILNQYAVDASMIVMPRRRISGQILENARMYGIGILSYGDGALEVLLSAQRVIPDASLRRRVSDQLTKLRPRGRRLTIEFIRDGEYGL